MAEQEQQQLITPTTNDKAAKIPNEIIFDILSRLPVKTLLQFRCVCKLWRSLIQDPCFVNLHLNHSIHNRLDSFGLFLSTYNRITSERHFLRASHLSGPTVFLFTLKNFPPGATETEHIDGLILSHNRNGFTETQGFAYIINPSMREYIKIPGNISNARCTLFPRTFLCYCFGYDPLGNDHKVLHIRVVNVAKGESECEIFSLARFAWKKIGPVVFPFDLEKDDWKYGFKKSVCVNGVIHWLLERKHVIGMFDLKEEKFSVMPLPYPKVPHDVNYGLVQHLNHPYLIKINGCLAVICHEHFYARKQLEAWVLEDYENRVWVYKTITFPNNWREWSTHYLMDTIHTGEIMLGLDRTWRADCLSVPFYDMHKQSFRFVELTLFPTCLSSFEVDFLGVRGYVESIFRLTRQ